MAYFFRGWADRSPPTKPGEGASLRQHVAARSATVVPAGRGSGGGDGVSGGDATNKKTARVPSPTPPPAVFSALGRVSGGRRGLEKLATQEVTYVGQELRIGTTQDGNIYVYERCAWPAESDVGILL